MNMTDMNGAPGTMITSEYRVRTDMRTRDLVDQAVALAATAGLRKAAAFLEAMNVSPEIAVRALVYPNQRRVR